jgi:hypothetical protein
MSISTTPVEYKQTRTASASGHEKDGPPKGPVL